MIELKKTKGQPVYGLALQNEGQFAI